MRSFRDVQSGCIRAAGRCPIGVGADGEWAGAPDRGPGRTVGQERIQGSDPVDANAP